MICWWYFILLIINFIRAQNPFDGGGFLADPFLELTAGLTTPINQKTNKTDSSCISNGTLAGSIIAALSLSVLIAFLTWMVYLRQKLQELQSYETRWRKHFGTSSQHHHHHHHHAFSKHDLADQKENQLPLDVTDYKFGTFPFRQSQIQGVNGQCHPTNWFNRVPSSFRSVTTDQDTQTMDIELLSPTFCGLNFSITGNMRAGIFIKEILDKQTSTGQMKLNSSDQLKTGDRIIALTVCFESIVYEDALTILSYASPYPVILRVQRPMHSTKINIEIEKRPTTATKVKWRDDFEHYDNDTPYNRSTAQVDFSKTLITDLQSTSHHRLSSKKSHQTQPRSHTSPIISKGNKFKAIAHTIQSKSKHSNTNEKRKYQTEMIFTSTGLSSKPVDQNSTLPVPSNKTSKKSVTNAVISYLHYRGANGGKPVTDASNNPEAPPMPYYDSPYDYYGDQVSQSCLNKNNSNNHSSSTESLTAVRSVYTLQLSSTKHNPFPQRIALPRRCERRLSSPVTISPLTICKATEKDISLANIDTCV